MLIDTETGLTAVEEQGDLRQLDAVIMGNGILPEYIRAQNGEHIWICTEEFASLLDSGGEADCKMFRSLIDYLRRERENIKHTNKGEQIRVHVAKRILI